jgi:hypothetical protein
MNNIIHEKSEPHQSLREFINGQLIDSFGKDVVNGLPIWRVSWAPDQFEKRFGTWEDYGQGGVFIKRVTEEREVAKYPHLQKHYVLERLVLVPEEQQNELCGAKISYEPIHPFWDNKTEPLIPNWEVCQIIVQTIYHRLGKGPSPTAQYQDPEADGNNGLEAKKKRVAKIVEGLYGNDTRVTDHLGYGTGVFLDSTKQGGKPN